MCVHPPLTVYANQSNHVHERSRGGKSETQQISSDINKSLLRTDLRPENNWNRVQICGFLNYPPWFSWCFFLSSLFCFMIYVVLLLFAFSVAHWTMVFMDRGYVMLRKIIRSRCDNMLWRWSYESCPDDLFNYIIWLQIIIRFFSFIIYVHSISCTLCSANTLGIFIDELNCAGASSRSALTRFISIQTITTLFFISLMSATCALQ